ncbi:Protein CBG06313 [Caenorhabditis briggsae]|uniref:Protein CBG06313 n=2 Tax=Caenorhabditis briggsae TaxID=6238 RepID=A8X1X7_CAEBR|nr:Protein CBG06313 [Caenorhabditis briggsae]CAP26637.1 Protein CBG06313 [Caenorhabditis briggsae]
MIINWAHFIIPKISLILTFITNPVFVYLIHTEKSFQFGSYKHLLLFFAIFNLIAAIFDILVPIYVFTYRYSAVFFIVEGPFFEKSRIGEYLVAGRCAVIGSTYGVLNSHFVYRFLSLKNHHFVTEYFNPYGLILSAVWVLFHYLSWSVIADHTMLPDLESRNYARESFEKVYGNMENLSMKIATYSEVSSEVMLRSWLGTLWVTILSSYSIILYFVLGYKIMTSLSHGLDYMSARTLQMQRRLFWALAIQTVIPIVVSFMPTVFVLYGAAFGFDVFGWINWVSAIAITFFPFLDPLAITMCLPALRHRIFYKHKIANLTPNLSNRIIYSSSNRL